MYINLLVGMPYLVPVRGSFINSQLYHIAHYISKRCGRLVPAEPLVRSPALHRLVCQQLGWDLLNRGHLSASGQRIMCTPATVPFSACLHVPLMPSVLKLTKY